MQTSEGKIIQTAQFNTALKLYILFTEGNTLLEIKEILLRIEGLMKQKG